jgi:hypothetical protein
MAGAAKWLAVESATWNVGKHACPQAVIHGCLSELRDKSHLFGNEVLRKIS